MLLVATGKFDRFVIADLNEGLPEVGSEPFDLVLALDVIEHLRSPEDFLDRIRALSVHWSNCQVILTTANIGFIIMRLSLLCGRFEYGKRGILQRLDSRFRPQKVSSCHSRLYSGNPCLRSC
jgi:2-polyprenyl-3-methyl-5-hydroxy-6-metoxy-1,4-benzoquinol methylase